MSDKTRVAIADGPPRLGRGAKNPAIPALSADKSS
jgi:hypothetical protein